MNFIKADFDGVKMPKLIFAYLQTFGVIHLGEKKQLFGGNIFWATLLPILGVFTAKMCLWNWKVKTPSFLVFCGTNLGVKAFMKLTPVFINFQSPTCKSSPHSLNEKISFKLVWHNGSLVSHLLCTQQIRVHFLAFPILKNWIVIFCILMQCVL